MTVILPKAKAAISWPRQRAAIAVLSAPLLLSSAVWILRDRRVWPWDPAWYGQVTIELWQIRAQGIGAWLDAMIHAMGFKPPLLVWAGQFFVPFRHLTGSVESALLFMNIALAAGAIVLICYTAQSLGLGTMAILAGAMACAGSQIFIGLTHQYLVELAQGVTIAALMLIAVGAKKRSATRTLSLAILTASLGLSIKTTSLMFILPLGGYIGIALLVNRVRIEKLATVPRWRGSDLAFVLSAVAATAAAVTWYAINWHLMAQHFVNATTGEVALNYGSAGPLLSKLAFWISFLSLAISPFLIISIGVSALIIIAVVIGIVRVLEAQPSHWLPCAIRSGTLFAITLTGTIVATLLAYSLQINEDTRFLMPIIPMIGVLVAWSLNVLSQRLVSLAFLVVFAINAAVNHAYAHGINPFDMRPFPWLLQVHLSAEDRETLAQTVDVTCSGDAPQKYKVIGVEYPEFNANSASFYSAKRGLRAGYRCNYTSLGYAETDAQRAWDRIMALGADYVVTIAPEKQRSPDFVNGVSRQIAERLAHDQRFVRVPQSRAGIWIFARPP